MELWKWWRVIAAATNSSRIANSSKIAEVIRLIMKQNKLHAMWVSVSGQVARVTGSAEIRDRTWSNCFGSVQKTLHERALKQLKIDFSNVMWADPIPLLAIACATREFEKRVEDASVQILLGSPRPGNDNKFLNFAASQGFIQGLTEVGIFCWDGRRYSASSDADMRELIDTLSSLRGPLAYEKADCIKATLFSTRDRNQTTLSSFVEDMVEKARRNGIGQWLSGQSRHQGFILQKIRILLAELADNILEHAYLDHEEHFGAIYARIRAGAPDDVVPFMQWKEHKNAETKACPTFHRANYGKQPGWLELFVCDLGSGLFHHLPQGQINYPLRTGAQKIFTSPLSRYTDRTSRGKTTITGLQHIGNAMMLGPEEPIRNDFVRIYTNGEWVGEHFPWPVEELEAGCEVVQNTNTCAKGTYFTFCLEPPEPDRLRTNQVYPKTFFNPNRDDLGAVRLRLQDPSSRFIPEHTFADRLAESSGVERGQAIAGWVAELSSKVGIIRPVRTMRKMDLVSLIKELAQRVRSTQSRLEILVFADVPTFLALDMAFLLRNFRQSDFLQSDIWPNLNLNIFIVTQEWCTLCYEIGKTRDRFEPSTLAAEQFVQSDGGAFNAAYLAAILRAADSRIFWREASTDAYINEMIVWKPSDEADASNPRDGDVLGYLDLTQANASKTCYQAAQRALRRALNAFRQSTILTADDLVTPFILGEFSVIDGNVESAGERGAPVTLAGSIKVSGSTTGRSAARKDVSVTGIVNLLIREDAISPSICINSIEEIIALEWAPQVTPPICPPARTRRRPFERIPNTPFVIRGGEGAIPLPRFAEPTGNSNQYEISYYGQTPDQAYREWQNRGLMKMGHWEYGVRHDLITINLLEAFQSDTSHGIFNWLCRNLTDISSGLLASQKLILLHFSSIVTDRIVRQLPTSLRDIIQIFPLKAIRSFATTPFMISPVEREKLGYSFLELKKGATVVIFDDGTVTGKSLTELSQIVRSVWLTVHKSFPNRQNSLDLRTIAILDRTGLPSSRRLVEIDIKKNPRFWRWDVPSLGNRRACPLCAALSRSRVMRRRLYHQDLLARLDLWEKHWRPASVVSDWSEAGLTPEYLPYEDSSNFCIEVNLVTGEKTSHTVKHRISTSRAALAAEIFRSTTRRDYPLKRARQDRDGRKTALTIQTRLEMLCSTLLLYFDDFSYPEKLTRFQALLDLLWSEQTASVATALAGLTLFLAEGAIAQDLEQQVSELIELHGLPNDDATLVASYISFEVGRRLAPRGSPVRGGWSVLQVVTSGSSNIRPVLSRIFQAFGWNEHSLHAGWLARFFTGTNFVFTESNGPPPPQSVHEAALMLEALSAALEVLPVECLAGSSEGIMDPSIDSKRIRRLLGELRDLVGLSDELPLSSRYAQLCAEKPKEELSEVFQKIRNLLFGGDGAPSLKRLYRAALTLEFAEGKPKYLALEPILAQVQYSRWLAGRQLPTSHEISAPARLADQTPIFSCLPGYWTGNRPIIYFDALVRQCIVEVASNVFHSQIRIPCPWSTNQLGEADMWYRLEIENVNGEDFLGIEFCNSSSAPVSSPVYRKATIPSRHLINIGGEIGQPWMENGCIFSKLRIPSIATLAWEPGL